MSVTRHQRFEYREVPRSEIVNAPYNPRTISAYARKKLKRRLAEGGLVETLVWNRRTGHLVSGHQRLELLDDLEGGADYLVGVAVVDLDEAVERTQNVFFNNIYAQGAYDEQRFVDVVQGGAQLDAMGFNVADLQLEFGTVPALDASFAALRDAQQPILDAIQVIERHRKYAELEQEAKAVTEEASDADVDYSIAILFASVEERDAFVSRYDAREFVWTADQFWDVLDERYRWRVSDEPDETSAVRVSGDSAVADSAGAV